MRELTLILSMLMSIAMLAIVGLSLVIMSIPLGVIYAWDWYRSGR